MKAWKQNENISFSFIDAHDLRQARDTSLESTIKRRLRERLLNSKVLVVLIGQQTRYLYRFVRWEMEQALSLGVPIIGVNLNGKRSMDHDLCPPIIRDELAIYISFNANILQYALEDWTISYYNRKKAGDTGPFYYKEQVYNKLGL